MCSIEQFTNINKTILTENLAEMTSYTMKSRELPSVPSGHLHNQQQQQQQQQQQLLLQQQRQQLQNQQQPSSSIQFSPHRSSLQQPLEPKRKDTSSQVSIAEVYPSVVTTATDKVNCVPYVTWLNYMNYNYNSYINTCHMVELKRKLDYIQINVYYAYVYYRLL